MADCSVCLGSCDKEIHQATVRVRKWFRSYVTRSITKVDLSNKKPPVPPPGGFTNVPIQQKTRKRSGVAGEGAML